MYYIGIHGISEANRYNLYVYGYSIEAPAAAAGPAAPEALTLVPDANGAFRVQVSVKAPEKTFSASRCPHSPDLT